MYQDIPCNCPECPICPECPVCIECPEIKCDCPQDCEKIADEFLNSRIANTSYEELKKMIGKLIERDGLSEYVQWLLEVRREYEKLLDCNK